MSKLSNNDLGILALTCVSITVIIAIGAKWDEPPKTVAQHELEYHSQPDTVFTNNVMIWSDDIPDEVVMAWYEIHNKLKTERANEKRNRDNN